MLKRNHRIAVWRYNDKNISIFTITASWRWTKWQSSISSGLVRYYRIAMGGKIMIVNFKWPGTIPSCRIEGLKRTNFFYFILTPPSLGPLLYKYPLNPKFPHSFSLSIAPNPPIQNFLLVFFKTQIFYSTRLR